MLLIVIILFIAYILIPLVNLASNERTRYFLSLLIYILASLWLFYQLFLVGGVR